MKFKCILNEFLKMGELLNIVRALSKHNERIIMITRPASITMTIPRESKKSLIWFDLNGHSFFSVYKMEGVNPTDSESDVIYFEVNATYLLTALGSMKKAVNFVEIKLGKQEFPFFTVNMRIQSTADQQKSVDVSNQVPVIIIPRLGWQDFELPYERQFFDCQAICPRFPIFKRFIDTFKYSPTVRFVLRNDDTLTLEAEQDSTKHFLIFNQIKVFKYPKFDVKYKGPKISALVDNKKISHFLHSLVFQTEIKLCCMIENNKNFKIFFRIRDDVLAHYITATVFDDDEGNQSSTNEDVVASDTD